MKHKSLIILIVSCLLVALSLNLYAGEEQKVEKKFSDIKSIKCKFALGDIKVLKSSDKQVHVSLTYTHNKKHFEPIMTSKGTSLLLEEKFSDNNNQDTGYSRWVISIPMDTELDINTGTGDITIADVEIEIEANTGTGLIEISNSNGNFDMNTGTGNVKLKNSEGEFDLNTGTGKVKISDSKGEFKANSGTGDVNAANITILMEAGFNSGTGDVEVVNPGGDKFELSLNSGTGDAVLEMDGQALNGHFVMKCNLKKGKIIAPFKFDSEEEFGEGRQKRIEKSYTKGTKDRNFIISTGTGKAVVKK